MKAFFLMSVIIPLGLLTTLRLTGVLQGPMIIAETTTLETKKWEFQRPNPDQYTPLYDNLNATYVSDGLLAMFHLEIWDYVNGSMDWVPPGDWVFIETEINAIATNPNSFEESFYIAFRNDSQPSTVAWLRTYFSFTNLSLVTVNEDVNRDAFTKGYVRLAGINHPSKINFKTVAIWFLLDVSSDRTHQIEVSYELTYYNGTTYKRIIQPFQLKMGNIE